MGVEITGKPGGDGGVSISAGQDAGPVLSILGVTVRLAAQRDGGGIEVQPQRQA